MKDYHFYYFQVTSMIHAMIGCIADPIVLITCGYRYNQENHLWYMILMVHSTAYFVYDSIVEYMAGSDDFLTNLHHACVIGMSLWHLCSRTSGFEYILLHFIAEVSNPFLIMRTVFKIRNIKGSTFEAINKYTFAVIFIIARALVTPLVMIYIYEADKVIYGTKFGVAFYILSGLFWVYRVLNLSAAALHEGFPESKAAKAFFDFTNIFVKNKRVRNIMAGVNFTLIFIIPHYYYGYVRQNLFNFSLD